MSEQIPPLPNLEIDGLSKRLTNQEFVDRALVSMYEKRPDLFAKLGERERTEADPDNNILNEIFGYIRTELKIVDSLVQPRIFWEARRRARLMYGLPIFLS